MAKSREQYLCWDRVLRNSVRRISLRNRTPARARDRCENRTEHEQEHEHDYDQKSAFLPNQIFHRLAAADERCAVAIQQHLGR